MISSLSSSKVLLVSFPWRNRPNPTTHFSVCFKRSQSIDVVKEVDPFTVSYFVNSCGLSLESAKIVSKHVKLKDPSNPDSVLDCLKSYGFTDAVIKKVIRNYAHVLSLNVERNLKPKMEFFVSIGFKDDDLVKLICGNSPLLGCSLDQKIIPCYRFCKRILGDDELVVKSMISISWIWKESSEKNYVTNSELLKSVGVPESKIQFFIKFGFVWLCLDGSKFSQRVNQVISMGFDPSKNTFIEAIMSLPPKSTWERKAQLWRSWGWSDSDISLAFSKCPAFVRTSEEKFTNVMDFLVNKVGWDPSDVAANSRLFSRSLKKSIIPRSSVIRVLMLKGLVQKDELNLYSVIISVKKWFLDKYVYKHLEQAPELLDILEGKVDISELGYGFEEKLDTKLKNPAS